MVLPVEGQQTSKRSYQRLSTVGLVNSNDNSDNDRFFPYGTTIDVYLI